MAFGKYGYERLEAGESITVIISENHEDIVAKIRKALSAYKRRTWRIFKTKSYLSEDGKLILEINRTN